MIPYIIIHLLKVHFNYVLHFAPLHSATRLLRVFRIKLPTLSLDTKLFLVDTLLPL